ncbi:hypothetical protein ABB37_06935 [Leptomonas pyrrhocoris]|uniref:PH domain-containing protein n=1 Tax=Leptomonas pyrrhocoris TaxID=157538 RepID=A0A0N0DTK7_LEPPY|nr:hypothetical protein ABB37_06935 [Leptomonas pyrrhocoris]KPA77561.1 hypothetical protein ABB37_06935 [Leptomonas pyrrhocoris]|eukprot:XP_015656000.1 hypothetical protein ABB37_06935 [Leptomonas pyrrhocoris]
MSGPSTSVIDSAVVCLRVMRRLLQDEEVTLAQLNYLIENIHDPIAQACLPPSQRPVVPSLSLSSLPSSCRADSSMARPHCINALARTLSQVNGKDKKHNQRQSPQPAVVVAAPGGPQASHTTSPATSKHSTNPIARHAAAKSSAAQIPLTFSQYWDLFANLPTLYAVQTTLVQKLEGIIQRLLLMVDELQPLREGGDVAAPLPDEAAPSHHGTSAGTASSPDAHAAALASAHSSGSSRKHVSALRFSVTGPIPGNRGVYGEIGVMVNEFFGSELVQHYTAEHMMYTVKYTQRAAPQLLRLARIWRWTGGATGGGSSGVSAAALANLSDADRAMLLQYSLFLDFLWRSFGRDGIPKDSRVSMTSSLESTMVNGQAISPTDSANADSVATAGAANTNVGSNNGQRRTRTTTSSTTTAAGTAAGPASLGANRSALPPLPATWEGFRTILMLLATPLGGLRRYSHVARCLVESGALQPKDRDRLQESFIDVVALRMSEETHLLMEELWSHDVAGIMALMDMPGSRASGDKAGQPANMRRFGAGAAGVGGVGLHNGHTIAQDSVAGAGRGTAAAATATSAASSPVSAAIGASSGNSNGNAPPTDYGNRALIHYGRLNKRSGRGRHERLIFLFSDWMCYVEECSNGRFRVRGTIPLPGLRVVEVRGEEPGDAMHGFELISPNLPKRLIFFTTSPEQRGQWVDAIRYTVRRFNDQQQPHPRREKVSLAGPSAAVNSSLIAPVVAMGESGLPNVMRATAPMLSAQSRLSRQRRYDGLWQDYVDLQRRTAEAVAQTSPMLLGLPSVSQGGGGFGSLSSTGHSPPPTVNLSNDGSRDSSFAGQRSSSTHRQLEYDVTPWSQNVSVHRRIRSQELLAAHQQQQQQGTAASSHTASPTHSAGSRLNASLSSGPEEIEKTTALPAGGGSVSVGDASAFEGVVSLPGPDEEGHPVDQLLTPLLLSPSGRSPGKALEQSRSGSLRPAFLEPSGSASTRVGGGGSLNASLRRPVSERFGAVKSMGGGGSSSSLMNSPAQQQQQQRGRSASSFNVPSSSPNPAISAVSAAASDAVPTARESTTLPPAPGATPLNSSRAAKSNAEVKTAAAAEKDTVEQNDQEAVSPPPQEPVAEDLAASEDSTTELSEPVEGEAEEEGGEPSASETASDVHGIEKGGAETLRLSARTAGRRELYSDVWNNNLARRPGAAAEDENEDENEDEEEDESSRIDAHNDDGSRGPSEEGADARDGAVALSEPYDEDLHDEDEVSIPEHKLHSHGDVAAGPALMSPSLEDAEAQTGQTASNTADTLQAAVSPNKLTEDDDAVTAVVTAFRRNSSPVRSVMWLNSPSQSGSQRDQASPSSMPLPTASSEQDDTPQRSRHVDPMADASVAKEKK